MFNMGKLRTEGVSNIRAFHDAVLDLGSVPLPFVIPRAREEAEETLGANGADGISDIEHVAIGNRAGRRQRS
jgi:hypothetical protein